MDYFSEEPRPTPKPIDLEHLILQPDVPEISLIFSDPPPARLIATAPDGDYIPYNKWKAKNGTVEPTASPMVLGDLAAKKQVRFSRSSKSEPAKNLAESANAKSLPKSFENLYLANIPNANLELSLVDAEPVAMLPNSGKAMLANQSSQKCTDAVEDFHPKSKFLQNYMEKTKAFDRTSQKISKFTKHEPSPPKDAIVKKRQSYSSFLEKNSAPKTVANRPEMNSDLVYDLYQMVQMQNVQLKVLQEQINTLLRAKPQQIPIQHYEEKENYVFETSDKKNQISVGLMTSFEVNFQARKMDPSKNVKARSKPMVNCCCKCSGNKHEADTGAAIKNKPAKMYNAKNAKSYEENECSLTLNEPLRIDEPNISPDNSIHLDMKDYSSESDEDSSSNSGWSFYKNVLGQVNNILDKTRKKQEKKPPTEQKNKAMKMVKAATLRHLRDIGVEISDVDSDGVSEESVSEEEDSVAAAAAQNDVSCTVKQILMKYLPDEYLGKLVNSRKTRERETKSQKPLFPIPPNTSIATMKYMQQYNITCERNSSPGRRRETQKQSTSKDAPSKILDITTLRQQPKLL